MRAISAATTKKDTSTSVFCIAPTTTFTTVASSSTCMDETNHDHDNVHLHPVGVLRVHSSPQHGHGINHNPRNLPKNMILAACHDHDKKDDNHHHDDHTSSVDITNSPLRRSMFAYDNMWDPATKSFVQLPSPKISTISSQQPTTVNVRPAVLPHNDSLTGSMETQPTSNVTTALISGPQSKSKALTFHWKDKKLTKMTKPGTHNQVASKKIAKTATTTSSVSGRWSPCNVTRAINTTNANSKSSQSSSSGLMINDVQQQQQGLTMNTTAATKISVAPQTDDAMFTSPSSPAPTTTPATATPFIPVPWYQKLGHVAERMSLSFNATAESLWSGGTNNLQSPPRQNWNRHDIGNNKSHPLQNQTSHALLLLSCTSGACVAATTALEDDVAVTPKINNFQRRVRSKSLGSLLTAHSSDSTKLYHLNQCHSRNRTHDNDDDDDTVSPCTEITLEASSAMIASWSSSTQPQQKLEHFDKILDGEEKSKKGNDRTMTAPADVVAVDTEFQVSTKRNSQFSSRHKKQLLVSGAKRWSSQSGMKQLPPQEEKKSRGGYLPHGTTLTRTTISPLPPPSSTCTAHNDFMQTPIGELLNQPRLSYSSMDDSIPGNNSCNTGAYPELAMPVLSLDTPHPQTTTTTTITTKIHHDDHNPTYDGGNKKSIINSNRSNSLWPARRHRSPSSMTMLESLVVADESEQKETEKENLVLDASHGTDRINKDFVKGCLARTATLSTQTPTNSSTLSTTATITPAANKKNIDHQIPGHGISPICVTNFL